MLTLHVKKKVQMKCIGIFYGEEWETETVEQNQTHEKERHRSTSSVNRVKLVKRKSESAVVAVRGRVLLAATKQIAVKTFKILGDTKRPSPPPATYNTCQHFSGITDETSDSIQLD